ncbi:hypothetical protein V1291_004350 [Nitrobacteraceae bacterium AZCC 1564]
MASVLSHDEKSGSVREPHSVVSARVVTASAIPGIDGATT